MMAMVKHIRCINNNHALLLSINTYTAWSFGASRVTLDNLKYLHRLVPYQTDRTCLGWFGPFLKDVIEINQCKTIEKTV